MASYLKEWSKLKVRTTYLPKFKIKIEKLVFEVSILFYLFTFSSHISESFCSQKGLLLIISELQKIYSAKNFVTLPKTVEHSWVKGGRVVL